MRRSPKRMEKNRQKEAEKLARLRHATKFAEAKYSRVSVSGVKEPEPITLAPIPPPRSHYHD